MRKSSIAVIATLTIILVSVFNSTVKAPVGWKAYYYRLKICFINKGSSSYTPTLEDRLFLIFPNTSTQKTHIYEADPSVKRVFTDEDGNLLAELDFPETIKPGGNITVRIIVMINITFRSLPEISVNSSGSFSDIPATLASYTVSSGAWRYRDEGLKHIAELAAEIKGNDTNLLRVVCKMVEFIGERVSYPEGEELRPPQYPNQTLPSTGEKGRGDCDDQSALLIAMLRSVGIPAYLQTGGVVSPFYSVSGETWGGHLTVVSKGIGWHGWVEAYIPPWGWLPVDITYGYYSRRRDPLSSIKYSASARELMLESERYSSIDFVAEYLKTRERIVGSSIFIRMEEEVSETPFPDKGSQQVEQPEGNMVPSTLFLPVLAASIVTLTIFILLKRASSRFRGKRAKILLLKRRAPVIERNRFKSSL
ncbi:MAG: transglutaminase domain-containing protein [Candidatus Brockarchaeota archaeon]|nr:transglutaminase domain-containing protein [Candidatus Brockarchaeota archaeon]